MDGFNVTPEMIVAAAAELRRAAATLGGVLAASEPMTTLSAPSGADEVSTTLFGHFTAASSTHHAMSPNAVYQLNHAADTLINHAAQYAEGDAAHAALLAAVEGAEHL
jgi:hypothetical protein